MKIVVDDERMRDLIHHILKNNYPTHSHLEKKELENKVMEVFDEDKLLEFIYKYIIVILKDMR